MTEPGIATNWLLALRRYLGVSLVGHFIWEILHLPLYTLWTTGTFSQKAFAVGHCTIGDAMIAGLSVLVALALFGDALWPRANVARVYAATVALGIAYTIYSEWMNTSVRGSWSYSDRIRPGAASDSPTDRLDGSRQSMYRWSLRRPAASRPATSHSSRLPRYRFPTEDPKASSRWRLPSMPAAK